MNNVFNMMKFDFGEFITRKEGICLILGCVFLIVGIILLIVSKKKKGNKPASEDKVEAVATTEVPSEPVTEAITEAVTEAPQAVEVAPIVNTTPVETPTEAAPVAPVTDTVPIVETPVATVPETPVTPQETAPVAEPVTEAPVVIEPVTEAAPVVAPQPEAVTEAPVAAAPVAPAAPAESVSVYGGVSPEAEIKENVVEEAPREIYGGANPLENTAPIPTSDVRAAYGGASVAPVETAPAEPVTEAPAPVAAPVEPAAPAEPQVETLTAPTSDPVEKLDF